MYRRGVPTLAPVLLAGRLALVGCGVLLAGCAAPGDPPVEDAATPEPESVARWTPPGPPTAVVLTLHGFNDRKAAFEEFGAFAASRGVLVEAFDQRGFGARRDRGRWAGIEALVDEVHERTRDLRAQNPGVPVYVLGESMGRLWPPSRSRPRVPRPSTASSSPHPRCGAARRYARFTVGR